MTVQFDRFRVIFVLRKRPDSILLHKIYFHKVNWDKKDKWNVKIRNSRKAKVFDVDKDADEKVSMDKLVCDVVRSRMQKCFQIFPLVQENSWEYNDHLCIPRSFSPSFDRFTTKKLLDEGNGVFPVKDE